MENIEFKMNKFGKTLTDRADGKKSFQDIIRDGVYPNLLDFSGVISMGSSFGDEILPRLAEKHNNKIFVKNANMAIKSCVKKVVEDTSIEVEYI